jgi:ribosome-associated toxin RatA of RatAB toxin-antitoxin module
MNPFHRKVQASAEFSCHPAVLYEILTDYDTYKEWMPQIRESSLLAEAGELAIARLDFVPPGEDYVSLECIHTLNREVLSRVIEGETELKSFDWNIEDMTGERTRLTLTVEGQTRLPAGGGSRGLLDGDAILAALRAYANVFMRELVLDGEAAEVKLEIFETANGLTCWFNGKEYEMKPVSKESK